MGQLGNSSKRQGPTNYMDGTWEILIEHEVVLLPNETNIHEPIRTYLNTFTRK